MVRSSSGDFADGGSTTVGVLNKHLPPVVGHLQLVQVEGGEIVHKVTLNLTTKNVDLGSEDVQGVAVATRRPSAGRQGSRPLSRSYNRVSH